jgi:hypothetical protein
MVNNEIVYFQHMQHLSKLESNLHFLGDKVVTDNLILECMEGDNTLH